MLRDLFTERTRVWLTIFAIAWGTISIGLMLGVGEGLRQTFSKNMSETGESLMIISAGASNKPYRGQVQQVIQFNQQDLQHLKALPDVMAITPEYVAKEEVTLKYNQQEYHMAPTGVEPEYSMLRNLKPKADGRFIDSIDDKQRGLVIVLGSELAQQLRVKENKIILLNELPFTVIGILAHKQQMFVYFRPDDYMAWIPTHTARAMWGDNIDKFVVKVAPQSDHAQLQAQIIQAIAFPRGLPPDEENLIHIIDMGESQKKINQFLLGMEVFLGVAGALTIIVAGAGIANVMFASVSSATPEIGVRKALGAQNYQILIYYIYQSLLITAIGGVMGILLTQAIASLINHLPLSGPIINELGKPQVILSSSILVTIITILGIIGLMAGLFPARRAAMVDPVVALRSH
jgi:putative ABC transport system permease protein